MEILGTARSTYLETIEKYINGALNHNSLAYYTVTSIYIDRVLLYSKKGRLHIAKYYLDIVNGLGDVDDASLRSWMDFYTLPKKAFYFFRSGDFQQAEKLTVQANTLCENLYEKGFHMVFFAGIQQQFNLARVLICSNRIPMGLEICSKCLIMLIEKDWFSLVDGVGADVFEQMVIENMYQIICKTLNLLPDRAAFFENSMLFMVNIFFGKFLSHPNFDYWSTDVKYLELKTFISLFFDFLKKEINFFQLNSLVLDVPIQDKSLRDVLSRYFHSKY